MQERLQEIAARREESSFNGFLLLLMNWETVLGGIKDFGAIAGPVAGIVRLIVALLHLIKALYERRIFEIAAFMDPSGFIEIQASNKSTRQIQIQEIQLVQDRSLWRFLLRKLIGIDAIIALTQLALQQRFTLPERIAPRSIEKLHANIDADQHDVKELCERRFLRPMMRLEIAGHCILTKLQLTKGFIVTREDVGVIDTWSETKYPNPGDKS